MDNGVKREYLRFVFLTALLKTNVSKLLKIENEIVCLPQKKMLERQVAVSQCESTDSDSDDGMKETGKKNIHGNDKLWHRSIWMLGKCDLYGMYYRILHRKCIKSGRMKTS